MDKSQLLAVLSSLLVLGGFYAKHKRKTVIFIVAVAAAALAWGAHVYIDQLHIFLTAFSIFQFVLFLFLANFLIDYLMRRRHRK